MSVPCVAYLTPTSGYTHAGVGRARLHWLSLDAPAFPCGLADAQQVPLTSHESGVGDGFEMLLEFGPGQDPRQGLGLDGKLATALHLPACGAGAAGGGANGALGRSEEAFDAIAGARDLRMIVGAEQTGPVAIGELQQMIDEVAGLSPVRDEVTPHGDGSSSGAEPF